MPAILVMESIPIRRVLTCGNDNSNPEAQAHAIIFNISYKQLGLFARCRR